MKPYDETKPLYFETDSPEVGLGAGLLHTTEGTNYPRDETPDNSILRPITLASNTEREVLGILHNSENSTITALPER